VHTGNPQEAAELFRQLLRFDDSQVPFYEDLFTTVSWYLCRWWDGAYAAFTTALVINLILNRSTTQPSTTQPNSKTGNRDTHQVWPGWSGHPLCWEVHPRIRDALVSQPGGCRCCRGCWSRRRGRAGAGEWGGGGIEPPSGLGYISWGVLQV